MSVQSRRSRRTVRTQRSAKAFARGAWNGVRTTRMRSAAKTASKLLGYLASRSRISNRNAPQSDRSTERFRACWVTHAVSGRLVAPATWTRLVWTSMTKNAYSVRSPAVSTVKQVGGQDTPRLAPQELAPRRAGPPWGRAEAMATQQRSDGRRRDSPPELGEFSLDPQASPPRVVTSYSQDQVANVGCDRRAAARPSGAGGPFSPPQLA